MNDRIQIILQILCSLNQGNTGYSNDRVDVAIRQYNQLVDKEIIQGAKIKVC